MHGYVLAAKEAVMTQMPFPVFTIVKFSGDRTRHQPILLDSHPDGTPDKALAVFENLSTAETFRATAHPDCSLLQFDNAAHLADYLDQIKNGLEIYYVTLTPKLLAGMRGSHRASGSRKTIDEFVAELRGPDVTSGL
jgi:hypothetical protein